MAREHKNDFKMLLTLVFLVASVGVQALNGWIFESRGEAARAGSVPPAAVIEVAVADPHL